MRYLIVVLGMLLSAASAVAQVSIGISSPGVSIGINVPVYPQLVRVPGYPVYYAPGMRSNYFFYDGMYWVYQNDNWYASSWYNGPWGIVGPEFVPLYVLRVPVRYYGRPPEYFRGWGREAPPRWGDHWGRDWEQRRSGWDRWDHRAVPGPAPLPAYQRQYSGNRYPSAQQQPALQNQRYRYQPRDAVAQQHFREQQPQAQAQRPRLQAAQPAPHEQAPTRRAEPPHERAAQEQARPARQAAPREQGRGRDQEGDREKGDERGQGHKR